MDGVGIDKDGEGIGKNEENMGLSGSRRGKVESGVVVKMKKWAIANEKKLKVTKR